MKKLLAVLFAFTACLFGLASCDKQADNSNVLVVGMECAYAPFNWTETKASDTNVAIANVSGSYAEGYDVQMAKKIANDLGYELKIKALDWDGLIPALKNGEIDMIIAGMSPTEERKASIDFTDGYYRSTHVILCKSDSSFKDAQSLSDLSGAKIAGQLGTIYADLVPQAVEAGAIAGTDLDTVPALVNQIKNGVLDGTIVEEPVAIGLCAADSSLSYIKFEANKGFVVAEEDVLVSIGVRKNYELKDKINAALAKISEATRAQMMAEAVAKNAE